MFDNNQSGVNYQIEASKEDSYENGLSTFDIVIIQKHILGISTFENPYKVIASDINNNEVVSGSDLVGIARRVLGYYNGNIQNDAWTFVKSTQQFFDIENPWPLIHTSDLIDVYDDKMNEDFLGIKMGDVNNDVTIAGLSVAKTRSNKSLVLHTNEKLVSKGETIRMSISADEFANTYGMQFTLVHESLNMVNVFSASLEIDTHNYLAHDGMTTFSWDNAYIVNINIRFNGEDNATSQIVRVSPNPMSENAVLELNIAQQQNINLKIIDAAGRVIWEDNRHYNSGKQQLNISRDQLNGPGLYYIQMSNGFETDIKKLLLVE